MTNKSKRTKIQIFGKIEIGKSIVKRQNQKLKHINRLENNCHIPDLVHAFPYVDNGGINLVLYLV